ncbi:hypothetical protein DXZ75_28145 [Streptomyces sp. AcE210]|nr:hypothetical protein DXZ75_28145 [Streptomyces sp. AcE210]
MLVEALARTGQFGVCKVAVRCRERIALLRPRHGILILHTLLWQDELRDPGDLTPPAPVTDRELELAEALIRELTGVEVDQLQDEYRHALEQLVEAKVSGGQPARPTRAWARGGPDGRTGRVGANRTRAPGRLSDWQDDWAVLPLPVSMAAKALFLSGDSRDRPGASHVLESRRPATGRCLCSELPGTAGATSGRCPACPYRLHARSAP